MNSHCEEKDCKELYPYYGLAPHTHDLSGRSFIGSSRTIDKKLWPENFIEDKEEPGCGVYYCPKCFNGTKASEGE